MFSRIKNTKFYVLFLFLILVIFFIYFSFILILNGILKGDKYSFFPTQSLQVTGTDWKIKYFQPVFLWSFEKSNSSYLKVAYKDKSGKVRLTNIFVGGELGGKVINYSPFRKLDNTILKISDLKTKKYPVSFGQRIRIEFLSSVKNPDSEERNEICKNVPDFCHIANYTYSKGNVFEAFYNNQQLKNGQFIPAAQIHESLIRN